MSSTEDLVRETGLSPGQIDRAGWDPAVGNET